LVYSHLEAAITDGSGACIYISGTPGTGKTATVREVVSRLDEAVRSDELDDFIFVEINGMKITDPHQSYSLLWEALRGQRVSPSQALDLLEREFNHPSPRRVPCVVLMDELDQLVTKNLGCGTRGSSCWPWPTRWTCPSGRSATRSAVASG
jgi:origin recognition complex subunit 1